MRTDKENREKKWPKFYVTEWQLWKKNDLGKVTQELKICKQKIQSSKMFDQTKKLNVMSEKWQKSAEKTEA